MSHLLLFVFIILCVSSHVKLVFSAERSHYIVHMDKSSMPKVFPTHTQWYSSTLNSLKSKTLVYIYDNTFHGFSAMLSEDELQALEKKPGFVSAYRDINVTLDTTHTYEFLSLNPSTGLWPASKYGEDVIVGVIDSGVWPESPSFKDDGMPQVPKRWNGLCESGQDFNVTLCNRKLIGVRYFNKGVRAAYPNIKAIDSGRDTEGHGTHTSSTVAGSYVKGASFFGYASGTARGVAPRARLAIYKVTWDEWTTSSDLLAGFDQAVGDGVDVISISMGVDQVPLYLDPIAIASFGAMEKGVFVSSSAGNDMSIGSLHNGIPWVLTVAAGSIDRFFTGILTLGNGITIVGWTMFPTAALVNDLPLLYNKTVSSCDSRKALSSVGYGMIVICENSSGPPLYKMRYVSRSNAAAAIFISDDPTTFEDSKFEYPGIVISTKDAEILISYVEKDAKPIASIKFQQTLVGAQVPAPVVASYTSRGPSPSCPGVLKPDVMAPGTLVLASWIPNAQTAFIGSNIALTSDFNAISGTSMACPHASGIAALLRGAHPEWSPAAIRSAIITTANPLDNTRNSIRDAFFSEVATPLAMGAGQVDPNRALAPGLVYDATPEDYVNLLCSMNFTMKQIHTITRSRYNCSTPSSDLNYPSFIVFYNTSGRATTFVQKFKRTVTYVGEGSTSYSVEVIPPKGSTVSVFPTRLVFRKKFEKKSYSLTIRYRINRGEEIAHGSAIWVGKNGKQTVRSPIVVTAMIPMW
ncbi:hypothetical protein RD792_003614 [Penstemon davidsonii]|uniref:Uncharacterized protein n=1 Tax=Penstemon davidsonii TaxID=160366 RepID=A0ABR0DF74_9LAMI|nr:hypothetical protein RD792_003614 [Penstemon davidsonii]